MDTRHSLLPILATLAIAAFAQAQSTSTQESYVDRINRMSEPEQTVLVKWVLDHGLPQGQQLSALHVLIVTRSSLALPLMESKIEEVLKSPSPKDCFTNKEVDPQWVVFELWAMMAQAGDVQALREASKLLKIDEKRFDRMVSNTMSAAINRGNPFTVAYQGLDIGDPAVDKRIMAFAEEMLAKPQVDTPISMKRRWAEALLDRYGAVPAQTQWIKDPIASRLKPEVAKSLNQEVIRLAAEELAKRSRK